MNIIYFICFLLFQVQLQTQLEQQVVDLIQEHKEQNVEKGYVSFRVSTKKLTVCFIIRNDLFNYLFL